MRTESKKIFTEALKTQITEQVIVRAKINSILSEGPMDGIWDKLKTAGTAVKNKLGLGGQAQPGADQQSNQVSQELMKLVAKTNQHRQKLLSSILKNSQTLDQYHNLVTGLVQAYQQNQHAVGTSGPQLVKQIQDAVGNFVYDLKSEKEQIDMFLKQIQDSGKASKNGTVMDPTLLGAAAKKRINASREQESSNAGVTSLRRAMPFVGGKQPPAQVEEEPDPIPLTRLKPVKQSMPLPPQAKATLGGSGQLPGKENENAQKEQILLRMKNSKSEDEKRKALSDLQDLFAKQINREKAEKSTKKKKSATK